MQRPGETSAPSGLGKIVLEMEWNGTAWPRSEVLGVFSWVTAGFAGTGPVNFAKLLGTVIRS